MTDVIAARRSPRPSSLDDMGRPRKSIAKGLKVGIVGGSIAGCAAAIELARARCEVTVLESRGEQPKEV